MTGANSRAARGSTNTPGGWRREALRANLWVVPSLLVGAAAILFAATLKLDHLAHDHRVRLPAWVNSGSADAARQVLTAIAAAVITVTGVVFSITIVALTLASTQFGPRILRNFVRDRGTQATLGVFVASFTYDVLGLAAISASTTGHDFVPHLTISIALLLLLVDLVVLIYFIHHVTRSIQLPHVMAGIGHDLSDAVLRLLPSGTPAPERGLSPNELQRRLDDAGALVGAPQSGYLQYIGYRKLMSIATRSDAVIKLVNRPGHFVGAGRPLAKVWPPEHGDRVARQLSRAHAIGPNRTPSQDAVFAIDQLVEIAIRALSPAVNDTYTALTCIDWLGDGLAKVGPLTAESQTHRDRAGNIRIIDAPLTYERLVKATFDKIRQAGRGMPAVAIHQLASLTVLASETPDPTRKAVLLRHARQIMLASTQSIEDPQDLDDVRRRFEAVAAICEESAVGADDPGLRRPPTG